MSDEYAEELLAWRSRWSVLPDNAGSNVLSASLAVAGAHQLFGFTVNNTNGSAQYILVFDAAALPGNGAVPVTSFVAAGALSSAVEWLRPRKMLRGIVLANSSTADSLTVGAADCFFDVQYL